MRENIAALFMNRISEQPDAGASRPAVKRDTVPRSTSSRKIPLLRRHRVKGRQRAREREMLTPKLGKRGRSVLTTPSHLSPGNVFSPCEINDCKSYRERKGREGRRHHRCLIFKGSFRGGRGCSCRPRLVNVLALSLSFRARVESRLHLRAGKFETPRLFTDLAPFSRTRLGSRLGISRHLQFIRESLPPSGESSRRLKFLDDAASGVGLSREARKEK